MPRRDAKQRSGAASFRGALNDGGDKPSIRLLKRMRDAELDEKLRDELAIRLLPFELPRLNSIEAEVQTTARTHEEWLTDLESGDED